MDNKAEFTKEQLTALISEAEDWAEIYEHPIHDKPQRDFFEGMARALTAYLATLEEKPVTITPETCRKFYADGVRAGWEFRSKNDTAGYNNVIETIMGAIKQS